jgi:hypothetical protein
LLDEIRVLAFRQQQTNRVRQPFLEMTIELADGYLSPREELCAWGDLASWEHGFLSHL